MTAPHSLVICRLVPGIMVPAGAAPVAGGLFQARRYRGGSYFSYFASPTSEIDLMGFATSPVDGVRARQQDTGVRTPG